MAADNHPLGKLATEWIHKIEAALEYKQENFGCYADAATNLYCGPANWMWDQAIKSTKTGSDMSGLGDMPSFKLQVNRFFEAVALYGPAMLHQVPNVQVTPTTPPQPPITMFGDPNDPNVQMFYQQIMYQTSIDEANTNVSASMIQYYLNSIQKDAGRIPAGRRCLTEAIITGMGGAYHELYTPPGTQDTFPRSRFKSQSDVVWDPDAKHFEDITWMAIRWQVPLNRFCEEYRLPIAEVRKSHKALKQTSAAGNSNKARKDRDAEKRKQTHDIVEYWEVYSKNGMGQWLHGMDNDKTTNHALQEYLESMGRYCRIVVVDGLNYPANLPMEALANDSDEGLLMRVQWPVPFYMQEGNGGGWPWSPLYYYEQVKCSYPMSLTRPVMPVVEFINYLVSCLADRTAASCSTLMGVKKQALIDFREQLLGQQGPMKTIAIEAEIGEKIADLISYIQTPATVPDVWTMLMQAIEIVDKGTGLTDIIYGQTKSSFRSATEADVKQQNSSIRPDDMANKTEEWLSQLAQKEMFMAYYAANPQSFTQVFGQAGAMAFSQNVLTMPAADFARSFRYQVEAGSTRRMNMAAKQASLERFGQNVMPLIQQQIQAGNVEPANEYIEQYGNVLQLQTDRMKLMPTPPPQINPQDMELQQENEKHQQLLLFNEEEHLQAIANKQEMFAVELQQAQKKAKATA